MLSKYMILQEVCVLLRVFSRCLKIYLSPDEVKKFSFTKIKMNKRQNNIYFLVWLSNSSSTMYVYVYYVY